MPLKYQSNNVSRSPVPREAVKYITIIMFLDKRVAYGTTEYRPHLNNFDESITSVIYYYC